MPFNSSLPADNSKLRISAALLRNNFQSLETYLGLANLNSGLPMQVFPAGTKMWFYQDTAPPGWTIVTGVADTLIGVKGASGAIYATGGAKAGSWQTADHALTIDEIPAHTHLIPSFYAPTGPPPGPSLANVRNNEESRVPSVSTGGDQPHNHGDAWRPAAAVGIIAVKT